MRKEEKLRASLLIVDADPDRWGALVKTWASTGIAIEMETSIVAAFPRIRAGRYTAVFFPVGAGALLGAAAPGGWAVANDWVESFAPNYKHRMVYHGTPGEVNYVLSKGGRNPVNAPILRIPAYPNPSEVERVSEDLDRILADIAARVRGAA